MSGAQVAWFLVEFKRAADERVALLSGPEYEQVLDAIGRISRVQTGWGERVRIQSASLSRLSRATAQSTRTDRKISRQVEYHYWLFLEHATGDEPSTTTAATATATATAIATTTTAKSASGGHPSFPRPLHIMFGQIRIT